MVEVFSPGCATTIDRHVMFFFHTNSRHTSWQRPALPFPLAYVMVCAWHLNEQQLENSRLNCPSLLYSHKPGLVIRLSCTLGHYCNHLSVE